MPNESESFKERSNKFKRNAKPVVPKPKSLNGLDETLINLFSSYIVSDNKDIHKYAVGNLERLMSYIPEDSLENQRMINKYNILKLLVQDKKKGLSGDLIRSDVSRKILDPSILYDEDFIKKLNKDEIEYTEKAITELLNTVSLTDTLRKIINLGTSYMGSEIINKQPQLENLAGLMQTFMMDFNRNKIEQQMSSGKVFKLSSMENSIEEIHKYVRDPSYNLVTGMQGMNALLGGGFQKGRVYCYFGMSGEGKTTTLENLLVQVWKHNKGIKTKDPEKKPCLVLFTMENLVTEYICSIFNIITKGKELKNCETAEEAIQEFKSNDFVYSNNEDIELIIIYEKGLSKDTSYCYEIIERLEEEGYETIGFFMDYLMRIKPQEWMGDQYKDYGNVINDFKTLALTKDIPIITASQLNREAAKIIEEGRGRNQIEMITKLGTNNIGDSIQIIRNLDGAFLLLKEKDQSGKPFMAYKLIKHRYVVYVDQNYYFQPFENPRTIALSEDIHEARAMAKGTLARTQEETRRQFSDVQISDGPKTTAEFEDFLNNTSGDNNDLMKNLVMDEPTEQMKELTKEDVIINDNTTKIDIIQIVDKEKDKIDEVYNIYFPGKKINKLALA